MRQVLRYFASAIDARTVFLAAGPACAVLALFAMGACSASDENDGSSEAPIGIDKVITPEGSDLPGKLLVVLPDGEDATKLQSFQFSPAKPGSSGTGTLTMGKAVDLPVGPTCLQDMAIVPNGEYLDDDCGLSIASGKTTTYALGVLQYAHTANQTLGLDNLSGSGSTVANVYAYPRSPNITGYAGGSVEGFLDTPTTRAARLPSKYLVSFGLFDGVETNLAAGAVANVSLDDFSNRRAAKITSPERDFRDAVSGNTTYSLVGVSDGRQATGSIFLAQSSFALVGEIASIDGKPANVGSTYVLHIGSDPQLTTPIAMSATAGSSPVVYDVQRLDINDVAETKSDGSVVMDPGVWTIEKQISDGKGGTTFVRLFNGSSFATKSGVDVVAGTYRITTTYDTVESGKKTTVDVVTVP